MAVVHGASSRHAATAALPIAAALVALAATLLPIHFAYRPNALGIVSLTTLREYPVQQEVFWYLFCLAVGSGVAWGSTRLLRTVNRAPRLGLLMDSLGVGALVAVIALAPGIRWPAALLCAAGAVGVARRATSKTDADAGVSAAAGEPATMAAGSRRAGAAWWIAALLLASIYSSQPMFPDGWWGGVANLASGVDDLALAADSPIFHGEWGEHLAWADRIRRGEVQGRDFFCLYGPLYELSLVAVWKVFGRSLASFTLWQGMMYGLGMLSLWVLGAQLVRQRWLLLALPLLVSQVSFRIGLPLLGIACLVAWRSKDEPRWCAAAGAMAGAALFFSQEFGLAFFLAAILFLALAPQRRAALSFGLGFAGVGGGVAGAFAIYGDLGSMLADLLRYPAYVSAGYGNIPFPLLFKRLPLSLLGSEAEWELKLRLAYALPAMALGALLLCLPLESMRVRRPAESLRRLRAYLYADARRLGIALTGLFALLSFRVALGRSDLVHLEQVTAPAALLMVVGFDRCLALYRSGDAGGRVAIWWAALLALVAVQSGLVHAAEPMRAARRSAEGFARLFSTSPVTVPDERLAWVLEELGGRPDSAQSLLALPNLAGYAYLLERGNPTRFVLAGMLVTDAHRHEVLRDLRARPPAHVLTDAHGLRIDGLTDDRVLGEALSQWLETSYRPVASWKGLTILEPDPRVIAPVD